MRKALTTEVVTFLGALCECIEKCQVNKCNMSVRFIMDHNITISYPMMRPL